jgi:hypothetical protein
MSDKKLKSNSFILVATFVFFLVTLVRSALGGENVIQQENMTFERCLKVIVTSESKLSITPEITDENNLKRTAIFRLIDGSLKIVCDREKGLVTVSTKTR